MSIAAVVLAAGASRRLGHPKQEIVLGGETLVERAVRTAQEADLAPVIVVLQPVGDFGHSLQQRGCLIVLNDRSAEGIASSIRLGVNVAKRLKAAGAVLMTCDQVAVTADHLRSLCAQPESITGSHYAGATGIPAYFPSSAFEDLLQLHGDRGARALLSQAPSVLMEALSLDIDTEQDLKRARQLIENKELAESSGTPCEDNPFHGNTLDVKYFK